jgi:LacI family transcriptional regulator
MNKKRTTIADVARAAEVSIMTVSRAVNDKPGVGPELRQRIMALAAEMGYRPNHIARGLATRQTAAIGLVVPDIANPFFAQIARGAEDAAFEAGYSLFLINTAEDLAREQAALDSLLQKEIDGIILCSSRLPGDELQESVSRFPAVVLVNRDLPAPIENVALLNVNDEQGARLAVQHMIAQGRQRIAFVAGPATSLSGQRRLDGYRGALKAAGFLFDPELLEHCAPTTAGGYAGACAVLARRPKVDAILAFNDLVAFGVIQACTESEREVPAKVAVIGFDDVPLAVVMRPQLTTLHVDLPQIGRLAMQTVLGAINGEDPVMSSYYLDPELIVRESA